jgi:hypothetical protein
LLSPAQFGPALDDPLVMVQVHACRGPMIAIEIHPTVSPSLDQAEPLYGS